ncbi:hypothetical protein BZK31_26615 [Pseudomonas floridensis]|uniref:Uncharacterized protein n=1 Tax=Pseudomonas floridensis TaxID=1958950 RepID=A0A1X0MZ05_9PSED|nr:hypothetical protein [Pseudomonas floridensis]ORC54052.1 hypothetical protein BZK31_26615 [Pseudomonas floridensis]
MINSDLIRTAGWSAFFMIALFMAFGTVALGNNWYVYFFVLGLLFLWTLYTVYVCERFVLCMQSIGALCVVSFTLPACVVAYGLATDVLFEVDVYNVLVGLIPAVMVVMSYVWVVNTKPVFQPFEYKGNRVQARQEVKVNPTTNYNTPLIGGITTLAVGLFLKWAGLLTGGFVSMFIMAGASLFTIFFGRHVIRGLRILRIQEKNMSVPYTFMQIDEIREARSRWWLGRFFRWAASSGKSTGA